MSGVDERIVRMTFDNAKFMNKAKQTIQVMANLKNSLKLDKVNGSFEKLQASADKLNFNKVSDNVQTITDRFSALGIIGITTLQRVTNKAIDMGTKLVSTFTIDPIKTGFQEYETQINAVQTILANTESKGSTLKDVNAALDELNKYADMTIYNFTEMTRNIGTFTAAGVDLDTSVAAIKGIANLAAVSGSTSQQASTAMYQLSQALASGTVKLQDWNSVVNAGMGGQVFQDALKETARVHKIAIDDMIKEEGSFRETLKDGWLSSQVLTETLQKFTGDLSEEQLKEIGYSKKQIDEIMKMGVTANDAATKVKTFTQLMDTLQEAAQSGWTQSWEIIIGDFEEAKEFLTILSDVFSDMLNKMADARNSVLEGWKELGGRHNLTDTVLNSWAALKEVVEILKGAFEEVFPPITAQMILEMTQKVDDFTESLMYLFMADTPVAQNLKNIFKGIFTVLKLVGDAALSVVDVIGKILEVGGEIIQVLLYPLSDLSTLVMKIADKLPGFVDDIKNFVAGLGELESVKMLFETFGRVFENLKRLGVELYTSFRDLVFALTDDTFEVSALVFSKIAEAVNFIANVLNTAILKIIDFVNALKGLPIVQEMVSKIVKGFDTLRTNISAVVSTVKAKLSPGFEKAASVLKKYGSKVKDFVKEHANIETVQTVLGRVIDFITTAFNNGKDVFQNITDLFGRIFDRMKEVASVNFDSITHRFWALKDAIVETIDAGGKLDALKGFLKSAKEWFEGFLSGSGNLIGKVKENLVEFTGWLKDKFANISLGDVIAAGAGGSLIAFALSLTKFTNAATKAIEPVNKVIDAFAAVPKGIANALNSWAAVKNAEAKNKTFQIVADMIKNLALLAGAVALLATMDPERVKVSAIALGALGGGLIILSAVCAKLLEDVNPLAIGAFAGMMTTTAISLFILVLALKQLGGIPVDRLISGLIGMGVLMLELAAFVAITNKVAPKMEASALSLIAMGISLNIMARAMSSMGDLSISQILAAVAVMGAMSLMLVALTAVGKNSKQTIGSALSIIAIAVAMNLMVKALNSLASMDADAVKVGLERLIELVGILAILLVASAFAGKNATRAGIMIIGITVALGLMAKVIQQLAEIDDSTMSRAGSVVKQILIVFGIITAATKLAGKYAARAGVSIGIMSASLLLIVAAIAILAKLDPEGVQRGLDAITRIMLLFAILTAATGLSKGAEKTMVTLGLTVGALAAAIAILSLINPDNLKAASLSLGFVIGMFAVLVAASSNVKQSAKTVFLMLGVIGVLTACLFALASLPVESTLAASIGLSALVFSLSASAAILQKVDPVAAAKGVLGFVVVVAAVGLLLAGLAALNEGTHGEAASFLQNGIPILSAIGEAIGSFVGSLVGSLAGSAIGTALEKIGTSLSNFMTNIQGFLDGASKIDPASLDGIGSLVAMILMLTGAELLNRLANFGSLGAIFGESGIDALGSDLTSFAGAMKTFVDEASGIEDSSLGKAQKVMSAVVDLVKSVTAEGGIKGFINGSSSEAIGNLADKLPGFARAMASVADTLGNMSIGDYAAIAKSIKPIKTLFSLLDAIKEEGGWEDYISGSSSEAIGNLSNVLPRLGEAMASYSASLTENTIDYTAIANSIEPAKNLFTLLEAIRDEGGVVDFWGGSASEAIGNLAGRLPDLGTALVSYGTSVYKISDKMYDAIYRSIEPCKSLFQLLEFIRNEGSVFEFFTGKASTAMENLSKVLPLLGEGLKSYADSLKEADLSKIEDSLPAVEALANISQSMDNESIWSLVGGSHTQALKNLSSAFPAIGAGLTAYSNELKDANLAKINESISAVEALAKIAEGMGDETLLTFLTGGQSQSLKNLASTFPLIGDGLSKYSDSLTNTNLTKINDSISAVESLASIASSLDSESIFNVFGSDTQALKNLAGALPLLGDGISQYCEKLSETNLDILNGSVDAAATLGSMVSELDKQGGIFDWINGTQTETLDKFSDKLPKLGQALYNFCSKLDTENGFDVDKVQAAANSLKTLSDIATSLGGEEGGLLGILKNLIGEEDSVGDLEKDLGALASALGVFASNISQTNMEGIESNIEQCKKIAEFLSGLDNINKEKANEFAYILRNCGDMGIPVFINGFANVDEASMNQLVGILDKCGSIVTFLQSIKDINKDNIQAFSDALRNCGDMGIPIFTKSISDVTPDVLDALNALKDGLAITVPSITESCKALKDAISISSLNFSEEGEKAGSSFTDAIKKALSDGLSGAMLLVTAAAANLYKAVTDSFKNAGSDFYSIGVAISTNLDLGIRSISFNNLGRDLMTGLAKGIKDNQSIATDAASKAASESLKAAKKALDSSSPSKKFIQLGADCDRGLAIGFDKYGHLVREAGSKIGVEAIENTKLAIDRLSELSDIDVDTSPKISPVLDASSVEAGAKKMNAMLDRNMKALQLSADVSTKMSGSASDAILQNEINKQISLAQDTDKVVRAIDSLNNSLENYAGSTTIIDGITYDDASGLNTAVGELVSALVVEGRM